jgi:pSer/pThr/pTyr-binding forkhead associated (FHA) protein
MIASCTQVLPGCIRPGALAVAAPVPVLRCVFSSSLGRFGETFRLDGDGVTLGRAPDCDVVLDDRGASRRHARIERAADGGWLLVDLGSKNGTRVNGVAIRSARLREGDRIELGLVSALEVVLDAAASAARRSGGREVVAPLAA